jgi:hypothetical protein
VPDIIKNEVFTLGEEKAEEIAIFMLGIVGFLIFLFTEKRHSRNLEEKIKMQKEASTTFKDLKYSYSYIGEINRRLDILINIISNPPEDLNDFITKKEKAYESISNSIKILGKTNNFAIIFFNKKTSKIEEEFIEGKKIISGIKDDIYRKDKCIIETDKYTAVCSPNNIGDLSARIIIPKRKNQSFEDLELMKSLASQALLFFILSKKAATAGES